MPEVVRLSIDAVAVRLRELSARQLPREWATDEEGVRSGEVVRPLRRVGCYVPGGRAAYPSTVLMTCVPARAAGVEEVVVCTPPGPDGSVHPAVLYACLAAGASEVHRVGGAQAVAALAYGTESIAPVDRIVGPGNAWVTAAKAEVAAEGVVAIDGLAGPTELALVADASAVPDSIAADLIAQAEHDPLAEATLITWDAALIDAAREALERRAPARRRKADPRRVAPQRPGGAGPRRGAGRRGGRRDRARAPAGRHRGSPGVPEAGALVRRGLPGAVHAGLPGGLRRRGRTTSCPRSGRRGSRRACGRRTS